MVLIGAAVGAYAWDQSKKDEIANGIKVGGVPIGGLSADQARQKLNRRLVQPLRRPVVVVSNVPARLLAKSLDQPSWLMFKLVVASTVIFCLSRAFWSFALRRYSSASS